jgi:misacylated tRNA(Ala) deacylase
MLQGPNEAIAALGQKMCGILDGKGNGKNNKFQAKVNNLKKVKECEHLIKDYFNKEE